MVRRLQNKNFWEGDVLWFVIIKLNNNNNKNNIEILMRPKWSNRSIGKTLLNSIDKYSNNRIERTH